MGQLILATVAIHAARNSVGAFGCFATTVSVIDLEETHANKNKLQIAIKILYIFSDIDMILEM